MENIPYHISESLVTIFLVKNTSVFVVDPDPESGASLTSGPGIRVKHTLGTGSTTRFVANVDLEQNSKLIID
jgi:hypothetical protein